MKNSLIAGVIGLLFMAAGFWYGLKLAPLPPPKKVAEANPADAPAAPVQDPISIDALRKTSEGMLELNQALQAREKAVAAREAKAAEKEDELKAEREALDRSHAKFKLLFDQFQQRLQLVENSQLQQLQKQAELYGEMGTTQSIELIRAMEDPEMIRLFSVMDDKPLAKLIAEWKTKYPEDIPRLLHALDGMAEVMPKEKIALSDPNPPDSVGGAPLPPPADATPAPVPTDGTAAPAPSDSAPLPPDSTSAAPPPTTPDPSSGDGASARNN